MLPIAWYFLKVIVCSGILYGYYWFLLRNKCFHGYNRFYLLATVVLSLLLPLLQFTWWQSPSASQNQAFRVLQVVASGNEYLDEVIIRSGRHHWTMEQLYPLLYFFVSLFLLSVFIRTLYLIFSLLKKYPAEKMQGISLVNTHHKSTPFSFLQYIFWNASIDMGSRQGQQIFRHELAHIRERHTYDKLFINATLIACWCNPFFWLIRKELNMIHEFIADKKAVENNDTADFAAMILQASYPQHQFDLTNNFFYSPLKRRLLMLTKNQNPRVPYFVRVLALPLAVLLFAAFTVKVKNGLANTPSAYTTLNRYDTVPPKLVTSRQMDKKTRTTDNNPQMKDELPSSQGPGRIRFDNFSGSRIGLDVLRKSKSIGCGNDQFTVRSATVYFSGAGFVVPISRDISSGDLAPLRSMIEKCKDGSVITFDHIKTQSADGKVVIADGISIAIYENQGVASQDDRIFSKVEMEASFPGGAEGWKNYLIKNINPILPVDEGWKAGTYTLIVQFIVHQDGTVSDVTTKNYPGSKTAQHCIDIIKNGPNWIPAMQNGLKVNAYRKQPITFVVEEENSKQSAEIYKVPFKVHLMIDGKVETYSLIANGSFTFKPGQRYYLNGKIISDPGVIRKEEVVSMESYDAGSGFAAFGENGKNGVLLIRTRG